MCTEPLVRRSVLQLPLSPRSPYVRLPELEFVPHKVSLRMENLPAGRYVMLSLVPQGAAAGELHRADDAAVPKSVSLFALNDHRFGGGFFWPEYVFHQVRAISHDFRPVPCRSPRTTV